MIGVSISKSIHQGSLKVYKFGDSKNKKLTKEDRYSHICLNCDVPADKCTGSCKKVNYGRY